MQLRKSFNFEAWTQENAHHLKPPVGNRRLFDNDSGMVIMVIGGPNKRTDYHDDPVDEFFFQVKGDMVLKLMENGEFYDVPIREGEVFHLPAHIYHSPQRPMEGSIGLVLEGERRDGAEDAFEWFCFECGHSVHRVQTGVKDIVKAIPPLFNAFYADMEARTCPNCGAVHPGKDVPDGWVVL